MYKNKDKNIKSSNTDAVTTYIIPVYFAALNAKEEDSYGFPIISKRKTSITNNDNAENNVYLALFGKFDARFLMRYIER